METGSKPRVPFWGFPLGLVSWTEQKSKTHMSDNIMPCEAYHCSGIWQKGERERAHTHINTHTVGFEDRDRAFWMAALADEETAEWDRVFFSQKWLCVLVCPSMCSHTCKDKIMQPVCAGHSVSFSNALQILLNVYFYVIHIHTHYPGYRLLFVPRPDGMLVSPLLSVLMVPQYLVSGLAKAICPN